MERDSISEKELICHVVGVTSVLANGVVTFRATVICGRKVRGSVLKPILLAAARIVSCRIKSSIGVSSDPIHAMLADV